MSADSASRHDVEAVLEALPVPCALLGSDGQWLYANPALVHLFGYPKAALSSLGWYRLVYPDDRDRLRRDFLEPLAAGGDLYPIEYRCRRGEDEDLTVRLVPQRSAALAQGCVLVSFENTTALRRCEALLQTQERLRVETQRLLGTCCWELDIPGERLYWSEEVFRLFGLDPERFEPSFDAYLEAVHAEDRDRVRTTYEHSVLQHESFSVTHRLSQDDGARYVEARGETFYDDRGLPLRSIGTVQDVTARVMVNQDLQTWTDRMLAVLASTPDGFLATDTNGYIQQINDAYCRQSGYTDAELTGMPLWELDADDDMRRVQRRINEIKNAGSHTFETVHRRKDGGAWPVEVSASYSEVDGGRLFSFVRDISDRREADLRIQHMAYHDMLTGLPNRELLSDRLRQAARIAQRTGQHLAVCYVDIDGFKPVNDQHGHSVGDELLIELSRRMLSELREGDTVARLGGDEFAVLLTGIQSAYSAEETVERLLAVITEPFEIDGRRLHVSASIGLTLFPEDNVDPDTLLRHADQAMYRAKEEGKGVCRLFDPLEQMRINQRRHALREVEEAIADGQLRLYFQPRVALRSGTVVGAETLVRWQHPTRGLLPPTEILPLIHGTPLEIALDEWVLSNALEQYMAFREQGLDLPLSINVSPQYIQRRSFITFLDELLQRYPDDVAGQIEIEILETSAIGSTTRVAEIMSACSAMGVSFSLDDFGTGYSSLTYFHRLPISILKVDQHFVRNMFLNAQDRDIVEGVLLLARALGRPVVAEGVESIEIALLLHDLGCDFAQGYGIARPMPPEDMRAWLHNWEQGSFFDDLCVFSRSPIVEKDLRAALLAHDRWLRRMQEYVESGCTLEPPELDEDACKFGRWCASVGSERFGSRPFFQRLISSHAHIHRLAQEIADLHAHAIVTGTGVEDRMRELEAESCHLESLVAAIDAEAPRWASSP